MRSPSSEWNNTDWLADARTLTSWADSVEKSKAVILIVRHSHRDTIGNLDQMMEMGLTPLGHRMATEFGRRLPVGREVEILHSFVPRCQETADAIAEGVKQSKGNVSLIEPSFLLVGPRADQSVWQEIGGEGEMIMRFTRDWVSGKYDKTRIEAFPEFRERLIEGTVGRISDRRADVLHVHVTHDNVMASSRPIFLGESATEGARPQYLGGFGIAVSESDMTFFDNGVEHRLPLPISSGNQF